MSDVDNKGDNNLTLGLVVGFIIGVLLVVFIIINTGTTKIEITACQAKLERDRYCVMVAVPSTVVLGVKEEKL